ncbi:hypothetical protein ACLMJK_008636 [Lecanora helva]
MTKAPIKLLLQIALGHISALETLVDAYAMIGEAMPRFDRLSSAFKGDTEFLHVMGYFYSDILEFHRRSYKFFRRRAWKVIFDSTWKTFNLRFHGILENLRKHRDLIDQEANAINVAESKIWRDEQLSYIRQWRIEHDEQIQVLEKERFATYTRHALAWLGAKDDQDDALTRLLTKSDPSTSHWALKSDQVTSWLDQGSEAAVLWLNGKPGAGKSVICSKIIEHIQNQNNTVVIFYFCSNLQSSSKVSNEILRGLVAQLLATNVDLASYILDTFANQGLRPNKKNLGIILEKLITSLPSVRIVIDGLDECPLDDYVEIVEDLLKVRGPTVGMCKVLLSSRKLPSIEKFLQNKSTLALDDHIIHINDTISTFVNLRLRSLHNDFPHDVIEDLGRQIRAKANGQGFSLLAIVLFTDLTTGMFLWVRLVMSTLEDICYERDLREAIKTLPEELEPLFVCHLFLPRALKLITAGTRELLPVLAEMGRPQANE